MPTLKWPRAANLLSRASLPIGLVLLVASFASVGWAITTGYFDRYPAGLIPTGLVLVAATASTWNGWRCRRDEAAPLS